MFSNGENNRQSKNRDRQSKGWGELKSRETNKTKKHALWYMGKPTRHCDSETFTSNVTSVVELHSRDTAFIHNHKSTLFACALKPWLLNF